MIASISTKLSRSSVPRLQPFHNPLTRGFTLTTPPRIFLAQHQILGPNVSHWARANNKVALISDLTEAPAILMVLTLAKDVIKLTDVDPNKTMGLIPRATLVTRVSRTEASEAPPEGIINKPSRLAQYLSRGIDVFCFAVFGPFRCFLDSHHWRWPISITSMRLDDRNTIFYSVHILTPVRLTFPGSCDFNFRCGVLGDLVTVYKKALTSMASFMAFYVGPTLLVLHYSSSPD